MLQGVFRHLQGEVGTEVVSCCFLVSRLLLVVRAVLQQVVQHDGAQQEGACVDVVWNQCDMDLPCFLFGLRMEKGMYPRQWMRPVATCG
mmetsp:Transcript_30479/g.68774  ORF Transcript_30479/g.68774 Transcript_30479/m.68774 type:complete len:89 (+) Transcript_30479:1529-1795(+)